jgi:response regulator of citrate/malate metabolism
MTSYLKMATVQEKATCVLWFFETESVTKTQRRYRTQYGKDPPSDNAIRHWLKQFKRLHRKGAGRPSTSQEDVDRIQGAFSRRPQKSTRRALQLGIPQTTLWWVVHNRLHLHASRPRKPRQQFRITLYMTGA